MSLIRVSSLVQPSPPNASRTSFCSAASSAAPTSALRRSVCDVVSETGERVARVAAITRGPHVAPQGQHLLVTPAAGLLGNSRARIGCPVWNLLAKLGGTRPGRVCACLVRYARLGQAEPGPSTPCLNEDDRRANCTQLGRDGDEARQGRTFWECWHEHKIRCHRQFAESRDVLLTLKPRRRVDDYQLGIRQIIPPARHPTLDDPNRRAPGRWRPASPPSRRASAASPGRGRRPRSPASGRRPANCSRSSISRRPLGTQDGQQARGHLSHLVRSHDVRVGTADALWGRPLLAWAVASAKG